MNPLDLINKYYPEENALRHILLTHSTKVAEKAVSIGNYVVATGLDTFLGVDPYVSGSDQVTELLTNGVRDWVEAAYVVEKDIDKLGDLMIQRIEEKREALGI